MAADFGYPNSTDGNYQVAGGKMWKVGGTLEVLNGGVIDLTTAGALIKHFFEAGTTTADLKPYGISTVTNSSGNGANGYTLGAPIAGVHKSIVCLMADSSDKVTVDMAASGATIHGKTGQTLNQIVFATSGAANNPAGAVNLFGESTSQWLILSSFGTVGTTS